MLHLKQLGKEEEEEEEQQQQQKPKGNRRKEIIKINVEINEKETKKTIAQIIKTKNWLFENINKIDKSLARIIKERKKKKTQINKIINEKEVTSDNTQIQRVIK